MKTGAMNLKENKKRCVQNFEEGKGKINYNLFLNFFYCIINTMQTFHLLPFPSHSPTFPLPHPSSPKRGQHTLPCVKPKVILIK